MTTTSYFTCIDLDASLTNCDNILVLDCRNNEEYRSGHICGSHNIVLPQLMMRRLKANKLPLKGLVPANFQQQKEVFLEKCMTSKVVLYDGDCVEMSENDSTMLALLHRRMTSEGCDVHILKGGYKTFSSSHSNFCNLPESTTNNQDAANSDGKRSPESKTSLVLDPTSPLQGVAPSVLGLGALRISVGDDGDINQRLHPTMKLPSEESLPDSGFGSQKTTLSSWGCESPKCIYKTDKNGSGESYAKPSNGVYSARGYVAPTEIESGLFLGCQSDASNADLLESLKIKYILNVSEDLPNTFEDDATFSYKRIPITDHWSQDLSQFFPEAIAFIDEALEKKQGILVHCLAGISRSVTVTVAYLMQKRRWSLNDAYDFVKQRKTNVSPNFNFMGQLLDFEKTLGVADANDDGSVPPSASGTSKSQTLFFSNSAAATPTTVPPPCTKSRTAGLQEQSSFTIFTTPVA